MDSSTEVVAVSSLICACGARKLSLSPLQDFGGRQWPTGPAQQQVLASFKSRSQLLPVLNDKYSAPENLAARAYQVQSCRVVLVGSSGRI